MENVKKKKLYKIFIRFYKILQFYFLIDCFFFNDEIDLFCFGLFVCRGQMYIDVCIEIDCLVVVFYLLLYIYKFMYLLEYCIEINILKYYDFYIYIFQILNLWFFNFVEYDSKLKFCGLIVSIFYCF